MQDAARTRLNNAVYLAFPFRLGRDGGELASRIQHVRQQIEQILFTAPGERWFRPAFGVGIRTLVFEPNADSLRELARQRLLSTLGEALRGEVLPESLEVDIESDEETVRVTIGYRLAALHHSERMTVVMEGRE